MTLSPTTCRICLQTDSRTTNIFFTYSPPDGSSTAASAISRYAFVQVLQDDGLPQGICNVCQTELHRTLLFIKLCEKSDKQLRTNCPLQDKFLEVDEPPAPEQLVQIKEIPPILKVHPEPEGTNSEETVTIKEEYNQPDELQNDELQKEFYNDISQAVENQEQHLNFVDVKDIQEDVDMSSDEGMLDEQNFEDESGASATMDFDGDNYTSDGKRLSGSSQHAYNVVYKQFMKWRSDRKINSLNENVLMSYFAETGEKYKPSTLWSHYSMLRSTLSVHSVDLSRYLRLKAMLKSKSKAYKPLKSTLVLSAQEVNRFLDEAPDETYLLTKVVLIIGIGGACNNQELQQITIDDIEDLGYAAVVTIRETNTFTITKKVYEIYKKYILLRPKETLDRRLFLNYRDFKCTRQPIGVHKIGSLPLEVAQFLGLPNPRMYTGHCFRRSSASLRIDKTGYFTSFACSRGK